MRNLLLALTIVLACIGLVHGQAMAMFNDDDKVVITTPKEVSTDDRAETPPPPPTKAVTKVEEIQQEKKEKTIEKKEEQKPAKTKTITHKVTRGDTLWGLAQKYLGDGSRYMELVYANAKKYPSLLKNPRLIIVGWELTIPLSSETTNDKTASGNANSTTGKTSSATNSTSSTSKPTEKPIAKPTITKPLTVEQKIAKLQDAVNRMNMYLLPQGKTLTELNVHTVRMMIDKGFLTDEEWMALNPPEGYRWVLEKGKVKLVNREGKPITNAEAAKANEAAAKEAAEKAKAEAEKATKEAAEKAALEKAAKEKAEKEKSEEAKKAAEKAAAEKAKAEAEKAAKEKAAKEAAEKAAKEKAAKEAAEKAKVEAEKAKSHAQKNFESDLAKIGMPNILGKEKEYLNAIARAAAVNPDYLLFYPYPPGDYAVGLTPYGNGVSLLDLQYRLYEAQKLYEEMVNKKDTDKFLGIFGNDIESASKKVAACRKELAEYWAKFQKIHSETKQQVNGFKNDIAKAQAAKKAAEDKLSEIDRYNPDNGPQVQALLKEIKEKDKEISKLQKKISYLDDLLKLFP